MPDSDRDNEATRDLTSSGKRGEADRSALNRVVSNPLIAIDVRHSLGGMVEVRYYLAVVHNLSPLRYLHT
jgi:hypothetical protein